MTTQPALFISHGSPMLAVTDSPAHRYLTQLGQTLEVPRAVVMVSAHWETMGGAMVSLATQPATIHDFGGFPQVLFDIRYPAPGAPALAEEATVLLEDAGFAVRRSADRGLDHGAWVPLKIMYPKADVPVFQVSILRGGSPADHERLGRALASLRRQNILVIGSGSMTHNLYEFGGRPIDGDAPAWVSEFADWMHERLEAGKHEDLLDYRQRAPFAQRNHPSEEHLMPLFVAMGAGGPEAKAQRIHASVEYGVLAMDVYSFA
jgi:4,5-DOPA dioxygenase extradiol